jgi:hypothetical protein
MDVQDQKINNDVKEQYIQDICGASESKEKSVRALMSAIYDVVEVYYDKDVAYATADEIYEAFSKNSPLYSISTISNIFGEIKRYKLWYHENVEMIPLDGALKLDMSKIDYENIVKNNMFFCIDELLNIVDDKSYLNGDYIVPFMILVWYGMSLEEIQRLKRNEVFKADGAILVKTSTQFITITNPRCVDIINSYLSVHGVQKACGIARPTNPNYFLVNFMISTEKCADQVPKATIRKKIFNYNMSSEQHKQVFYISIWRSGVYDAFYEMDKAGQMTPENMRKRAKQKNASRVSGMAEIYKYYKEIRDKM